MMRKFCFTVPQARVNPSPFGGFCKQNNVRGFISVANTLLLKIVFAAASLRSTDFMPLGIFKIHAQLEPKLDLYIPISLVREKETNNKKKRLKVLKVLRVHP